MAKKKKQHPIDAAASVGLDDIPEGILLTDTKHEILAVNKAALDFLGYAAEELIGWPLEKVFPQMPAGLNQALSGAPATAEFQIKVKTRSGRRAIMDFLVAPVTRSGAISALIHVGRNARVRRLLEEEIKKARNYFGVIIENSPYGICVTDPSRRIMITNKAVEDLTGYSRGELIGKSVLTFYAEDKKDDSLDMPALRQGRRVVKQKYFMKKSGEALPVKVSQSLVVDPDDQSEIIIESYSNQTDRLRIDQLKNEFVFIAAHELRNPVSAVRMLLDIIYTDKRVVVDPVLRGYLSKIQEANDRLLNLVEDLLEVSRTEAGRLKISVTPQNIVERTLSVLAVLKSTAAAKDVALHYAPRSKTLMVTADATKLEEILTNLVTNAVKYNVTGGSVTVEHEVSDGMLVTRVSDTGIGISGEDQKKLFQKFWRSDDLAVRAQAGTGLGLFIVKELTERMGGKIWVESRRGEGSIFSFSLPMVK